MKRKILLAEDEPALGQIVQESLQTRGYEVIFCKDGQQAFEAFTQEDPDLLVLDVMMPKKDGFTLASEIRNINPDVPIIFLTAKSQTEDVVQGFNLGGNDYLKKPFSIEELIVRIENQFSRPTGGSSSFDGRMGAYHFDPKNQTLQYKNESPMALTHRESQLLLTLAKSKDEVLERSIILNNLWGNDDFFNGRSMDVFISKLRKKLAKDSSVQIINVRGFGYKLIW